MPQLRQDFVTLDWVAIATERAKRPSSFARMAPVRVPAAAQCPFCPGHEAMTPPEVMAYRTAGTKPNAPGWQIRVVPNLYPAFGPSDEQPVRSHVGPYLTMTGVGVHEVLISGPGHEEDLAQLDQEQIERVVKAYIDRFRAHENNPTIQYLLIIHNHGKEAGASLEHPHSQLFGIPLVPRDVEKELAGVRRYRSETGRCVYCDIVATETTTRERVILENASFVVFAPFASRTPFEAQILAKWHAPRFAEMTDQQQRDFAEAIHGLTARIRKGLDDPPFNFFIHTLPCHRGGNADYHWHLEMLVKLTIAAGFELGSGIMINVVTPEAAAEFLRGVEPSNVSPRTTTSAIH